MKKTINIPKALHEIHGERTTAYAIFLAHSLAVVSTTVILLLGSEGMAIWQRIILGILAYDLVGGVVANFSQSTSLYYAASATKRRGFLLLHFLQPILLTLVYTSYWPLIAGFSAYILITSAGVNAMKTGGNQAITGAFCSVTGLFFLHGLGSAMPETLLFLFAVFLLKLPLAWAVRWHSFEGTRSR